MPCCKCYIVFMDRQLSLSEWETRGNNGLGVEWMQSGVFLHNVLCLPFTLCRLSVKQWSMDSSAVSHVSQLMKSPEKLKNIHVLVVH